MVALVLIVGIGQSHPSVNGQVETVKRVDLVQSVMASGKVVSSTDLSLSFESQKMIDTVKVRVGDVVKKGDILATQKSGTERAAYTSARGTLLGAQARYQKVLEGSSNEEIGLAKTTLETTTRLQDALVDNARRNLYSQGLVAEPESANDVAVAPIVSGTYTGPAGEYRLSMSRSANELTFTGLEKGMTNISDLVAQRLGTRGLSLLFPNKAHVSIGNEWTITIPNTASADYITLKSVYDAAVANRDALVAQAQAALDLKRATARQPDVDAALADIVSAQAGRESAFAVLEKTILRAPSDGTVTKVDIKVGEVPEALKEAIVIQDVGNLYLEANVNESQIKNVAIGQPIAVTFDAFGSGTTYQATISSIDPAATIIDNTVNYTVKALITQADTVRPGMTANMTVTTQSLTNVLVLPGRAISADNGTTTVTVLTDGRGKKTETRTIVTGLHGDGDMVEIKSGLAEGDKVVWQTK